MVSVILHGAERICGSVLFAAAGIATGSGKPKTEKVGKVTKAQVEVGHTV